MTAFARWCRFNLVGVMGMGVQLGTLAVLNRLWPRHAVTVSVLSLEVTLLHNFLWHQRYTWRERRAPRQPWFPPLLRFHVSNGAVSLAATLLFVPLATHWLRLPVVPANLGVIVFCSLLNFVASDRWAFTNGAPAKHPASPDILERLPPPCCGPLRGVHGQSD